MDGLRGANTAVNPATGCVTSTRLKGHITEHMRRATEGKFRSPLEPDFVDEGAGEVVFGASITAAPPTHSVRLEVRSVVVMGLEVAAFGTSMPILRAVPSAVEPAVFEYALPVGLYEATPIGAPLRPSGQEWLFKVVEGGVTRAF